MSGTTHDRYRKYADVMLGTDTGLGDTPRVKGVSISVTVEGESVDDVADRALEHAIEPTHGPEETAWNTHEGGFSDPNTSWFSRRSSTWSGRSRTSWAERPREQQ